MAPDEDARRGSRDRRRPGAAAGSAGVGDPATDVIPAWAVFGRTGRAAFRAALEVDDATWNRARGIALHQAAALIPYYSVSNPAFAELGRRTVAEVVADVRSESAL